jgi:hypothetical protein
LRDALGALAAGNAFAILGSVVRAMRAAKLSDDEIKQFLDER